MKFSNMLLNKERVSCWQCVYCVTLMLASWNLNSSSCREWDACPKCCYYSRNLFCTILTQPIRPHDEAMQTGLHHSPVVIIPLVPLTPLYSRSPPLFTGMRVSDNYQPSCWVMFDFVECKII